MGIVTAGVHHGNSLAAGVCGGFGTCVGQAGFLFDGEGVHVGTKEDGWACSIAEDSGEAIAADVCVDFEAEVF